MLPTLLLEPTSPMPVTPKIRSTGWNDDKMPYTDLDPRFTAGTHVRLACLIRLDGTDDVIVPELLGLHAGKSIRYSVLGIGPCWWLVAGSS